MKLLIILAVLVVLSLAGYAIFLYLKLSHQKAERAHQQEKLAEALKERREHHRNSIRVIASAIVAKQVSLTEGAIRISMLSSQLELSDTEKTDYQVFFQLTEATAHIPILDEWKKLNSLEKHRFDIEREELGKSYRDFVENAARKLLDGFDSDDSKPLFYSVGKD